MAAGNRIEELRLARGWSRPKLGILMGTSGQQIEKLEKGLRRLSEDWLVKASAALGVEPGTILTDDSSRPAPLGPTLYCKGAVAAGAWRAAVEAPEDDWASFTGRPDVSADISMRFGLKVEGDSMDELYPPGTIVECVSVFGRTEIATGKRIVVVRKNKNGLYEATVKELQKDAEGRLWAVPKSSNPSHMPIDLSSPGPDIVSVRITAVVVGSFRPE